MTSARFQNRFGLLAAFIGMAVGTGNIWRFPRVMAQNGGGAFLIPWLLFLFLWSVPLLMIEFSLGQKLRKGVIGCFSRLSNGKLAWLGGFVVLCTCGIMFYYCVITGWCLHYFFQSVSGAVMQAPAKDMWAGFTAGRLPLLYHGIALVLTLGVIGRGIRGGVEAVSRVMIPVLFIILFVLAGYSMTLTGKDQALVFIFNTDFSKLTDYRVWLEALTQSAWSTGAGWGIALTYAAYARDEDHPVLTPFTTGLGNNSVELLAVMVIMPAMFSFLPLPEVVELTRSGNVGLTFIALPGLFQKMQGGQFVSSLFFLALFFAAFTSLFSMFELGVSFIRDLGFRRGPAIVMLAAVTFLFGSISAVKMDFLNNQDWVWGVGLLISGFFFSLLIRHIGMESFCRNFIPLKPGLHREVFRFIVFWLIPLEFLVLIIWWFYQSIRWSPENWWNPWHASSIGTCVLQWTVLIGGLIFLNKHLARRVKEGMS